MQSLLLVLVSVFLAGGITTKKARLRGGFGGAMRRGEAGGNGAAMGNKNLSEPAYGPLQIRQPVCDDVNAYYGTNYTAKMMQSNRTLSIKVFWLYLKIYTTKKRLGREPTDEDRARIWNGGPNGWKRDSTKSYWKKVQKVLG